MVVTEASARRDGRFVEVLGTYEPQAKRSEDELNLKLDRIDYWKSVGAKATDTAASLIRKVRRQTAEFPLSRICSVLQERQLSCCANMKF